METGTASGAHLQALGTVLSITISLGKPWTCLTGKEASGLPSKYLQEEQAQMDVRRLGQAPAGNRKTLSWDYEGK